MTFEALLVKYLYQNKQVTLQGFGTVVLGGTLPEGDLIQKNRFIPVDGLSFTHNFRAVTDEAFVAFFSEQRGKIKPLAISDIESHLQLARQLMNIGKAYELPGLGIFEKQSNGSVILHPGFYAVLIDDHQPYPSKLKERAEVVEKKKVDPVQVIKTRLSETVVEDDTNSGGGIKKWLLGIGLIILLGAGAWLVYSKYFSAAAKADAEAARLANDTTNTALVQTNLPDTTSTLNNAPLVADSNTVYQWKAYFRTINDKAQALARNKVYKTTSSEVFLETADSVNFRFYVVFEGKFSDTTRKADSISRFFARPVVLEKLNP